jgi:hypothetical protein
VTPQSGDPLQLEETGWMNPQTARLVQGAFSTGKRHHRRRQLAAAAAIGVVAGLLAGSLLTRAALGFAATSEVVRPSAPADGGSPPASLVPAASSSYPSSQVVSDATSAPSVPVSPAGPHLIAPLCSGPCPKPARIIAGQATWWNSFGPGRYAAIRPDLGSKGDLAVVCGGKPFHCLTLPIITTCACLGPGSGRLIDLSLDAFAEFADPSRGVVRISLQVVPMP